MHTKAMILNPVRSTEEEIRHAREFIRNEWRSFWWFGVLMLLSIGAGIYGFTVKRSLHLLLSPLVFAAMVAYNAWRSRSLLDVKSMERRFTIREDALVVEVVLNDRDATKNVIPWTDVLFVKETKDSVELRLRSGGTQKVPNECFVTEEQKKLLLQRASPANKSFT